MIYMMKFYNMILSNKCFRKDSYLYFKKIFLNDGCDRGNNKSRDHDSRCVNPKTTVFQ